jgi:hypothetical protein
VAGTKFGRWECPAGSRTILTHPNPSSSACTCALCGGRWVHASDTLRYTQQAITAALLALSLDDRAEFSYQLERVGLAVAELVSSCLYANQELSLPGACLSTPAVLVVVLLSCTLSTANPLQLGMQPIVSHFGSVRDAYSLAFPDSLHQSDLGLAVHLVGTLLPRREGAEHRAGVLSAAQIEAVSARC